MKTTFWELLNEHNVIIPIIQRDYAQGRNNKKANVVRKEFLADIKETLDNRQPLDLDFVYGHLEGEKFHPLDGQQRLTTLFLLHWYTSTFGRCATEQTKMVLQRFSYETRLSSRRFCEKLVDFTPSEDRRGALSDEIKNQPWFFLVWNHDPTIQSMLRMLDDIDTDFREKAGEYFLLLTDKRMIEFKHLDLKDVGLTDTLYIKMNARGKPLTQFENFKARMEKFLDDDPDRKKEFSEKADGKWTELFWKATQNKLDDAFMRYFDFIAEVGFYLHGEGRIPENDNTFKFEIFRHPDVLDLLFASLDCWCEIEDKEEYVRRYFSTDTHETGKVRLYDKDVDFWSKYVLKANLTVAHKLLFYGVILQLVAGREMRTDLRLLRNLIENSSRALYEKNLPAIYRAVRDIMSGKIDYESLSEVFSGPQVKDEQEKQKFIEAHPALADELYHFEDHELLRGRMSVFDLDSATLSRNRVTFERLFEPHVDRNTIHRAALCFGSYCQHIGGDRWRFANDDNSWSEVFTASDVKDIKNSMGGLLDALQNNTLDEIISKHLDSQCDCDKTALDYYFIKYNAINDSKRKSSGIYAWSDDEADLRMLSTTRLTGYWRDLYVWAVVSHFDKSVRESSMKNIWNIYRDKLPLTINGIEFSFCKKGWRVALSDSADDTSRTLYTQLCSTFGIEDNLLKLAPPVDRVAVAVEMVRTIL